MDKQAMLSTLIANQADLVYLRQNLEEVHRVTKGNYAYLVITQLINSNASIIHTLTHASGETPNDARTPAHNRDTDTTI